MERALLERKDLDALIAAVRESAVLYAPTAGKEGTIFRSVESAAEISLGAVNTRLSAKGVFFPQREILMRFNGSAIGEIPLPGERIVVFGARPCDARALVMLDKVFGGARVLAAQRAADTAGVAEVAAPAGAPGKAVHEDPYYLERRNKGLVISLACDEPCESCFCTSVDGNPYGTEGADILASGTGAEDPILFEAVTEKGKAFLSSYGKIFTPAGENRMKERENRAAEAAGKIPVLDFSGMKARLDGSLDSPLWDSLTKSCLGCGVCTYLCPTCHCFDITDETRGNGGVRVRSWDSCQYSLFTLHASGHNPRPAKKARMRQRIMHKYSYTVETADEVFCTGCGRCVRFCPVNLDIRQMLVTLGKTL
jgi:ferredoxin